MALIAIAICRHSSGVWVLNLGYLGAFGFGIVTAMVIENGMIYFWFDSRTICVRLYTRMSVQSKVLATWVKSGRKVGEESTKPLGFTMPHYFYIHNISLDDFSAIQTARGGIYIFTTGTPYKISSRALLPPSLRTVIFTVKCYCPETFRKERPSSW